MAETETKQPTAAPTDLPRAEAALPVPVARQAITAEDDSRVGVLGRQLTIEQIELLKRTVAKGASDDEIAVFAHVCNRTGLDPFVKQIHAIKRRVKDEETQQWREATAYQIGIDGFRLIAKRTGEWNGTLEPLFFDAGGNARTVWLEKKPPVAARVGVKVKGVSEIIYATVLWSEYVQTKKDGTPTKQWAEKPVVMLGKCAEAAALRKAFPQELSGLYSHEEMAHLDESDEPVERPPVMATKAASEVPAVVLEDGDVELRFGTLFGRRLSTLTLEECARLVVGWSDPDRFRAASERLGDDVAQAIASAFQRLNKAAKEAKDAEGAAATQAAVTALPDGIARMCAVLAKGMKLAPDAAEDLRQFVLDHPEAEALVAAASQPQPAAPAGAAE